MDFDFYGDAKFIAKEFGMSISDAVEDVLAAGHEQEDEMTALQDKHAEFLVVIRALMPD